jgi:hypothetical protein
MKHVLSCSIFLLIALSRSVYAQGWYAEVDLDFNHDLYAYENIARATFTFSGVTVSGSSATSKLHFEIKGVNTITGDMNLSINGVAWQPYDPIHPYSEPISARFSGKYNVPCETGFFEQPGDTPLQQIYIWIRIYPRLQISNFVQLCDKITLTSNICSPSFRWEISDSSTGNFKILSGKTTSSIIVTRQELIDLGFPNSYGRKYFRVSGKQNTTSQLQAVDIYYPGPTASIASSPPQCHNGTDGSVNLSIATSLPSIDDFVVTLFNGVPPQNPIQQDFLNNGSLKTFTGLKSGSYWVRIENNTNNSLYGNCWTDYSIGTLQDPEPVTLATKISDYNGYSVTCAGSKDGRIEVSPLGGSGTYTNFKWSPDISTSNVAEKLSAGDYHITVTDSRGCSSQTVTMMINEPEKFAMSLLSIGGKNGYDVSCPDRADGSVEAQIDGGVPGYSYEWSNGNTSPQMKDLAVGEYTVIARDKNNCTTQATIALKSPAPIDFTINELNGINCPGDETGALEISSITNAIGNISYLWSSGETVKDVINKRSGTYSATVSDSQGCSVSRQHNLLEPLPYSSDIVAVSDFNGVPIRCNGEGNGELQAFVYDPQGAKVSGQHYTWYRNGVLHKGASDLATLKEIDAATYRVEIHYTAHCRTEATYVLDDPDPIVVAARPASDYNGMAISCNGASDGSILAQASGGSGTLTFTWSNQHTGPQVDGLTKGTYAVIVKDANACEARTETVLKEPDPLDANITILSNFNGQALSCWGASDARLGASAKGGTQPYKYTWSNGPVTNETSGLPQGEYTLTAVDANGCVDATKSTIQPPAQLRIGIVASSNYNGYGVSCTDVADGFLQAEAVGGTGDKKYQWPATKVLSPLHTRLPAGAHTVIATDANGCNAITEGFVTAPPTLIAKVVEVKNVLCYGGHDGQIELHGQGGTGVYMYSASGIEWQPQPTLSDLAIGTYAARLRDQNGCEARTFASLIQPEKIVIDFLDVEPALCGDPKGQASTIVRGGVGGYTFLWLDSENKMIGEGPSISGLRAGIFSVTIQDGNQCRATNYTSITSTDGAAVEITDIHAASCSYTEDGGARVEVMAGNGPFSFQWQDGQTTAEALRLSKGPHLVKITDANDCAVVKSVNIPAPEELVLEVIDMGEPQCHGDCNGNIRVQANGGNGTYSYLWGDFEGAQVSNLCAGEYSAIATDKNGCLASQLIRLTEPVPLALAASVQQPPSCPGICDGALEVQLTGGSGDVELVWLDGHNGPILDGLCDGTFTVIARDSNNCLATGSFTLQAPQVKNPDLGGSATLCAGQTHILDGGADWRDHLWTGNNGFKSTSRFVTLSESGMYVLQTTTREGCFARDTFFLETSTDLLKATFLLASQAFVKDTIVMIDISWPLPELVKWELPQTMKVLERSTDIIVGQFPAPGKFDITLEATLGACQDEVTKTITILDNDAEVDDAGRLITHDFVKEFTLYPNPNDGMFDVAVEFAEESSMVLTIWNVLTSKKIAHLESSGKASYLEHIDLRPLSAGSYSLRLDYNKGTRYIRFIVR